MSGCVVSERAWGSVSECLVCQRVGVSVLRCVGGSVVLESYGERERNDSWAGRRLVLFHLFVYVAIQKRVVSLCFPYYYKKK